MRRRYRFLVRGGWSHGGLQFAISESQSAVNLSLTGSRSHWSKLPEHQSVVIIIPVRPNLRGLDRKEKPLVLAAVLSSVLEIVWCASGVWVAHVRRVGCQVIFQAGWQECVRYASEVPRMCGPTRQQSYEDRCADLFRCSTKLCLGIRWVTIVVCCAAIECLDWRLFGWCFGLPRMSGVWIRCWHVPKWTGVNVGVLVASCGAVLAGLMHGAM